jgi:hypothetical protein
MKKPAVWFRLIIGDHFRRVSGLTRLQRGALNDLIVNYFSERQLAHGRKGAGAPVRNEPEGVV